VGAIWQNLRYTVRVCARISASRLWPSCRLRETIALTLFGIALGVPCALAASRLIASTLFSVSSTDAPTLTAVSLLLLGVALFAGYLPARRASAIDPMIALRTE